MKFLSDRKIRKITVKSAFSLDVEIARQARRVASPEFFSPSFIAPIFYFDNDSNEEITFLLGVSTSSRNTNGESARGCFLRASLMCRAPLAAI